MIASTNETLIGILGKLDTFKDFEHFNVKKVTSRLDTKIETFNGRDKHVFEAEVLMFMQIKDLTT